MKKTGYIVIFFMPFFIACNNELNIDPTDFYTQDTFWETSDQAIGGLTGCYEVLTSGSFYGGSTPFLFETMSPNAFNYSNAQAANDFALGTQTGTTSGINETYWEGAYKGIGRRNTVIEKVPAINMDADLKARIIAEAKFLRAFYYDKINTVFNGVPLILTIPDVEEHSQLPRNTYEEVLEQIMKDLNEAVEVLPVSYPAEEQGRATKGAALALKARILLQNRDYEQVIQITEQIFALGEYELFSDYNGLFRKANEGNSEIIFDVRFHAPEITNSYDIILAQFSTQAPLQGLVDVYQMIDGKPITKSDLYDPGNPYNQRDPRFEQTILYLGAPWRGRTAIEVDLHQTGYTFRKFTEYNAETEGTIVDSDVNYIVIRYADVLLMYAEAANEINGPTQAVYDALNAIRSRPTVEMPHLPSGMNQGQMREMIRLERRIELAGEQSYFYDIRRWGTIEDEMTGPIYNHNGEVIQVRSFDPARDYLWPIPYEEIDLNPNLEQNPAY